MKFRIVQIIHGVDELKLEKGGRSRIEWIVEKKTIWGWKEIVHRELKQTRISHQSYADAEAYMICNYMGHGECRKDGNVYTFKRYTYYA